MTAAAAEKRSLELLERVNLFEHRDKQVEDPSRGMTQLVQFIGAIIHDPEFIILDEPFASNSLAESVSVRALNEPDEWGPSDHCRLEIVVN